MICILGRYRNPLGKLWYNILFTLFIIRGLEAQEYHMPTDASQIITSSFGEYRSGHFHAGIDFKTWGRVGYNVFAIEDGSIVRVRISPYGYGRVVYLRLNNGMTVVYAHLLKFSESVERLIKAEQRRRGKFAVERYFSQGFLPVKKGEILGYTGRSGTRDPHLHFEIRDEKNRPFNPFFLRFPVEDTIPPVARAIAVSPLSYGSHVDGDFLPKVFPLRRLKRGQYALGDVIRGWGRVGLSITGFDQANGASNKFGFYRVRLFVDDHLVFSVRYDRFSYSQTQQIDLDRDYRLKSWGWGLYQKLYVDVGNKLSFYEPASVETGILCCGHNDISGTDSDGYLMEKSFDGGGAFFIDEGDHAIHIEVMDYFGNISEVRGVVSVVPLSEVQTDPILVENPWEIIISQQDTIPNVEVNTQFFEKYIRFDLQFNYPLPNVPSLIVGINSWERRYVPLILQNDRNFIGTIPWENGLEGMMTTEVRYSHLYGLEKVVRDTLQVFAVTPELSGSVISSDGNCSVFFPEGAVYQSILTYCRQDTFFNDLGIIGRKYSIFPQDVVLRRGAKVMIDGLNFDGEKEKIGIYGVSKNSKLFFIGNDWENGSITAWTGNLNTFTVLKDTVTPEIHFISPAPDVHIKDSTPKIAVGFDDALSGISGEENYVIQLDNIRLIVEYDPINDMGFHRVEEPLQPGRHVLDITIKDRAGNTAKRRTAFYIDP